MATILFIDDDMSALKLVGLIFEKENHRVVTARAGEEGLNKAFAEPPDLVICDLMMPGLDGYEVCRQLRRDPRTGHLPILVLTARAQAIDREASFEAGADDYLAKPFRPKELVNKAEVLLREGRNGPTVTPGRVISRFSLKLGPDHLVDPEVLLGYVPNRGIGDHTLVIGSGARIRSGTVIYAGTTIGAHLETGHNVVIREGNMIGDDFHIWNNSVVDYGCTIGCRVKVHCDVYIAQFTVIEDDVFLAPGVMVANDLHPGCSFSKECMGGPVIKRGAQIGVNTSLLPFVTIGERAVIGAGSVVTKDVPPRTLAYGNPARVVKDIHELDCIKGYIEGPYFRWE